MNSIDQRIFTDQKPFPRTIQVRRVSQAQAGDACLHLLSGGISTKVLPIGIAYHIDSEGKIDFICLSNLHLAFVISFDRYYDDKPHPNTNFANLLHSDDGEACRNEAEIRLVGFSFPRTAIHVNRVTQRHVRGVDLSTMFGPNPREPWSPPRIVKERVLSSANAWDIACLWLGDERTAEKNTCLQAWLAACVATQCSSEVTKSIQVNTRILNKTELACLSNLVAQLDLLDYYKPKETINDFSSGELNKKGNFVLHNTRFKSRVRQSQLTHVVMTDVHGREYTGNAQVAKGKRTTIRMNDNRRDIGALSTVKVLGREELTNAEKAHDELLFLLLTCKKDLRSSPFVRDLWFPTWKEMHQPLDVVDEHYADSIVSRMGLNDSQRAVVQAMVGEQPIVVTHGPPGTGKTTTIAAASRIWDLCHFPVWIVAHSNVAVKNIAETLFKKGVDFKLIVSKEFYVEWHEHLYCEIQEKVRRSDELPTQKVAMERELGGSHIILSTLSMISNPSLHDNGTFDIIPVERIIIDEASQINIFEFMHIFVRFQLKLQKVCFFGDPKQLPPFGQDNVPSIKTIFDLTHKSQRFFLNVQYRMPLPIGNFISNSVYDGRLHSEHSITDSSSLAFVDVSAPQGFEEQAGTSWTNPGEVQTMVHLVQTYYKSRNFCVITPYDAQRAAIERGLQNANLPWDSVYNVDSFQGNEADYVLVSVVRSSRPGFLVSLQRMNVLLTRCRRGLVIVTSRGFVASQFGGYGTLLGLLVRYWKSVHMGVNWIDWRDIASGTANLPGAPSRPRRAADRIVPFSIPGSAYFVPYGMDPFLRSNGAGSQLSTNGAASQYTNFEDRDQFPTCGRTAWPILSGSWTARDMSPFSVPKVTQYSELFRPRAKYNSVSYAQAAAGNQAAWVTPSSSSTNILMPKHVRGRSTLDTQARTMQGIPHVGTTSTYNYHLHSLLTNKSMTAKEAENKTNAQATHKSTATAQPTLHRKYPATTTAQPSNGSLGNFIRSIVVYS